MVGPILFINDNGFLSDCGFENNQFKITFTLDTKEALRLPLKDEEDANYGLAVKVVVYLAAKYGTENLALFDHSLA